MTKILIINSGTNILEILTAIDHAKGYARKEGKDFDTLYLLQAEEDDQYQLKRLAEHVGAEIYHYTDSLTVRSNYLPPVELDGNDSIQFDYTGNNKRVATNAAARIKRAQQENYFYYVRTYLETEGKIIPTIQSDARGFDVYDARNDIEMIDPPLLNNLLFGKIMGESGDGEKIPSAFSEEFRGMKIKVHSDVQFFPSQFNSWAFDHVVQVGAHQLIFFVKVSEYPSLSGIERSLFELYMRMNRIGGYSARGVLLYDNHLHAEYGREAGKFRNNMDDLIEGVADLCETDIERATKTRYESSFDRYDWKSNVSSRTSRLMPPRVEVWGIEKYKDSETFKKSLERYLELIIR